MELGDCSQKCVRLASKFRPCLCDFVSEEDAIIDLYIKNTTKHDFFAKEISNVVTTGPFAEERPGQWIIPPPKRIRRGETVFARGYSGKVSTTDEETCIYPVIFVLALRYTDSKSKEGGNQFLIEVQSTRNPADSTPEGRLGCAGLQPFQPINEFSIPPVDSRFQTNLPSIIYESDFPALNIFYLLPQINDPRWRNTAFFLLS